MFTSLSPNEVGSFLFSGNLSFFYFQPQQLGHNAHHTEYLITVKVINKWKINVSLYQQYIAWSWIFRNISNFFILDIYKHLVSSTFILITHQGEFSLVGPSPDENFIDISCSCDKATHWILVFILSILLSKAKWTVSMAPEWPCKFGHITSQCLFCSQWLHRFKREPVVVVFTQPRRHAHSVAWWVLCLCIPGWKSLRLWGCPWIPYPPSLGPKSPTLKSADFLPKSLHKIL